MNSCGRIARVVVGDKGALEDTRYKVSGDGTIITMHMFHMDAWLNKSINDNNNTLVWREKHQVGRESIPTNPQQLAKIGLSL